MNTSTDDRLKLDLLTKIAELPPEQLKAAMGLMDRADTLVEFAKLPPIELSVMLAKLERHNALQLAKGANPTKRTARRTFADWGTPLNPR